jgi:hypothetical protein
VEGLLRQPTKLVRSHSMTPAAGNARLGLQPGIVWESGGGPLAAMRPKRDELRRELGA